MAVVFNIAKADCLVTLAMLGLIAGSLWGPCVAVTTAEPPWWINSCTRVPPSPTRHGRSAEENQLKIFIKHVNGYIKTLKDHYPNVPQSLKLRWLNLGKIQKIMMLPVSPFEGFHHALQVFAMYMEKLKQVNIRTNANYDEEYRKRIYFNATKNLKIVICEFEELLDKHTVEGPKFYNDRRYKLRFPKNNMDLTEVQMTDVQFFTKLRKFLNRGRKTLKKYKRLLRRKNKNKSAARKQNKVTEKST